MLMTNNFYMIALGRQAICESVRGSFAMTFHSPIHRLLYFFSLSEGVCVGLGFEFGPCTGPPNRAQELRNSHSIPSPCPQHPLPSGPYPISWTKEGRR